MSEADVISRALRGDEAGCRLLYTTHAGRVMAYFRRCRFASPDVEDLAQEVFVRVFRSLHTFDASRGTFRPWLATIARNVARRHWQRQTCPDHMDPKLAEAMFESPDNPVAATEAREQIDALRACVDALPPPLASIIRLRYVEGKTTRGIAEVTRLAEATVRLRLQQAKDALQRCLKAKGVSG